MDKGTDLRIEFDWQEPGSAKGPELRATWAALAIFVKDTPVTEILDRKTRSVRNSVYLPLYPLAEWIADNWWFLQVETEKPSLADDTAFDRRHNLRWAREGFVLPALQFVPLGETVLAHWQPIAFPDAGVRFLTGGSAVLSSREIIETLRVFVDAIVLRLHESNVTGTSLAEQWQAVEQADSEEQEFCRASARLGADPYALEAPLAQTLLDVASEVRPDLLDDFLSLSTIDELTEQARSLKSASDAIASDADSVNVLGAVRRHAPRLELGATPWESGYQFAAKLREALNGGNWKSQSLDDLAGHLKVDRVDRCLVSDSTGCRFLDALAGSNRHNNPKFIIDKKRPDSTQFAFCRALFEHLTSPPGKFAAVSRLRTERQQMNRAFAAEFLAPHWMLRDDLSAETVGEEEIAELASDYGVSAFVIQHQLENHRLARVAV